MAKYLITVWPYLGSLNPLTAVGRALSARGHSVAFYSGRRAQTFFEGEGFTFFPLSQELDDFIERMLVEPEGATCLNLLVQESPEFCGERLLWASFGCAFISLMQMPNFLGSRIFSAWCRCF